MGGSADSGGFTANYVSEIYDGSLGWKDIAWLKRYFSSPSFLCNYLLIIELNSITNLPIMAKGILRADDAELAAEYGVAAIIVSNHGGRQLDGVPATVPNKIR